MKEEWKLIQYTFHVPRGRFEGQSVTEVPWGWHVYRDEEEEGNTVNRYFTYYPSEGSNHMPGIRYRFAFPAFERLRNVDRESTYSHLLRGKVQVATLMLDTLSIFIMNFAPERGRTVEDVYLVNKAGERVGWLRLNIYGEQWPAHGTECELIAIS
jgi:hypothetical protein